MELEECADVGQAPRPQQAKHYSWAKTAGQKEPRALLTEFYSEIYGMPEGEKQEQCELQSCESVPLVTRAKLDKALGKLKKGKGSHLYKQHLCRGATPTAGSS